MLRQLRPFNHTLLIPGLLPFDDFSQVEFSSVLSAWLKASVSHAAPYFFYSLVMQLFGYAGTAYYDWASLRVSREHFSEQGFWLCADPIHLSVDVAHVYSLGNAYFDLTLEEAAQYIDYLNQHLPVGCALRLGHHPLQWYLVSDQCYQFEVCPPEGIFGKTLLDKMPQGSDRAVLLALFNDIQMLLYGCDLNHRRRLSGRPTIDALWLWGSGKKIDLNSACPWGQVISNNDIVLELATLNHIDAIPLTGKTDLTILLAQKKATLIVDDQYQFRDLAQKPYLSFSAKWLKYINELYPGNGKKYIQKKLGIWQLWQRILSI